MNLHFAHWGLAYFFLPIFLLIFLFRWKFYKSPVYLYPLTQTLASRKFGGKIPHKKIFALLRTLSLLGLIFLIMRPQWADERSKVNVEGINIALVLDVSGSMSFFDDLHDKRSRIEVAKSEAVRFIEKRSNDPIGLVVFGKDAISQCPLTLDKQILKDIIGKTEIGIVNPDGTWLGTGLATAINRLRNAKAKSKIVILLTDGNPTPHEKVDPNLAIELAQKFGIKIYTIGIGNENGCFIAHPIFGMQQVKEGKLNTKLLKTIAEKTGGTFFRANNPREMREIYNKIDALEKTLHETSVFHRYYEAFFSFIWIILMILGIEIVLRFLIWRGV